MKKRVVFCLLILSAFVANLPGIETGDVRGSVVDEKGISLPGVEIRAVSPHLQGMRTVLSSRTGDFHIPLLPVGTYKLTFLLEGFAVVVQENVIVRLGQTTSLSVTTKISVLKEEIVVTAKTPLIDKTASDTSFHISGRDLEKMPAQNRTVVDAVKFTPGVTGVRVNTRRGRASEGQPSFRGEGQEGNNWVVDGLSISGVRLKNSGVRLNFDSIEEMQVISDPFSPEFGSAYGGIINMVTKSGSNKFRGDFSLIFADRNLQSARQEQLSVVSEPSYFSNQNWYLNLGGPILKDKLWFFISNNFYRDTEETLDSTLDYLSVPGGRKTVGNNNLFTKLTYSPQTNHTLSLTTIYNKSLDQKGGTGIPELYVNKKFSDLIFRLNYKAILSPSAFIEAGLGQIRRDSTEEPLDGNLKPAMYFIEDLAQNIHNSYGLVTDDQKRLDFSFKLTKFAETESFGRHEFNLGFEYYSFSSVFAVDFSGQGEDLFPGNGFDAGTKYFFDTFRGGKGTPTFFYEYGNFNFINSARGIGVYLKDRVTIKKLTLMVGLRSQTQLCLDDKKEKLWSWGLEDFLSPRITATYDLTGDGVNVIRLGWGMFSDMITTMPLGLFNSGAGLTFRTYRWAGPKDPSPVQVQNAANWRFQNEQKTQGFEVNKAIQPNFLTRYLIEFNRKLAADWALKVRYVRTKAENLLEVLAIFDPKTIYKFLYDNFELKRRHFSGFELELNGKIGKGLFLNASYCHSSAKGTNPGQAETGAWSQEEGSTTYIGLFGNHLYIPPLPELKEVKDYLDWALGGLGGRGIGDEGWYGKLPYSIDHNVKLNAVFLAPFGLAISTAFEWISGYYWEKLGYVPFFGGYYAFPEGRGTRETPSHSYLDISIEKSFRVPGISTLKPVNLSLRLDFFNALNSQTPISYIKENIPLFGAVWGRQQPRQARAMAKLSW